MDDKAPVQSSEVAKDRHDNEAVFEVAEPQSRHSNAGERSRTNNDGQDGSENEHGDLESLRPAPTNTPQWSVFTLSQKRYIVLMVAMAGFFSPLSANIFFPALNILAADFHVSQAAINTSLTSYMIFQGLGPTIMGDLADVFGRRPAYLTGFVIYIGACIGIASCQNYASLIVLRCLQATGCAGTIALASGVVADISVSSERGQWMGWASSGPMIAPAIAPVFGGIFTEFLGWRWIFWFLVIATGAFLVPFLTTFPETGRNVVGNGSIPPQGWNMSLINYLQTRRVTKAVESPLERTISRDSSRAAQMALAKKRKLRIPNPIGALKIIAQKDVAILLFYNSLFYCAFYDVMASAPYLLQNIYGYNSLKIGLCFLPFGVGCFLAPTLSGKLMDWNFRREARQIGYEIQKGKANDLRNFPLERVRGRVALPLVLVGDAAMLSYGWAMQAQTSLAAPLVLMFIQGLTFTGAFNILAVMLVDLYPMAPATAQAANNLVRCLMGAGATAVIVYMIEAMTVGWAFTFIAAVVALSSPMLWALERWGPRWREERRMRMAEDEERKDKEESEVEESMRSPEEDIEASEEPKR